MSFESALVFAGALILLAGLYYSFKIVSILQKQNLAPAWIVLTILIVFFLVGFILFALQTMGLGLLVNIPIESIASWVFFFGSIFVLMLTVLNSRLFIDIFGIRLSDKEALIKFAKFLNIHPFFLQSRINPEYSITCDTCNKKVKYAIPDIVRAHPNLERGVKIEEAMGTTNYTFFLRHRCTGSIREIPVTHDEKFEYRSKRASRVI
jgi:hypothetical protein